MKFVGGKLFVVLISQICALATAQDQNLEQPAPGVIAVPDSDPMTAPAPDEPAPVQSQSTAPSTTMSLDDGLDEWCRPSWNCCRPFCSDPCCTIYGQVQALFLTRGSRFSHQPIVVNAFPGATTTFLSTSNINPDFTPGVQATFGMPIGGGRALELDYFSLFPGNASAVVANSVGGFMLNGDAGGNVFQNMDRVAVQYTSWINSFALNFPCCCGCCDVCCDECCSPEVRSQSFSWFAGFRYLNFGDRLNIAAQGAGQFPGEQGAYRVRTTNNLYGAQLGARMRRTRGRFGWDATGQAGIYGNDAQQSQLVTDFPAGSPALRNVSTSKAGVAFVGQGNLSGLYALTNVWNLRAGYNVIWIEGLAQATDQLNFNFASSSGNQVNNNGGVFLHGVNIGLEARW